MVEVRRPIADPLGRGFIDTHERGSTHGVESQCRFEWRSRYSPGVLQ
jgi:hypothetical protein